MSEERRKHPNTVRACQSYLPIQIQIQAELVRERTKILRLFKRLEGSRKHDCMRPKSRRMYCYERDSLSQKFGGRKNKQNKNRNNTLIIYENRKANKHPTNTLVLTMTTNTKTKTTARTATTTSNSRSATSSYLVTTLKHIFQCGSLNDVSDYVATTSANSGLGAPCQSKSSSSTPSASTSQQQQQQHQQNPTTKSSARHDEIPGLEEANSSSASSIYVVPSREALEDMVRDSRTTRRQGLFDMDRLFACGSREAVADDDDDDDDDHVVPGAQDVSEEDEEEDHNSLDTSSPGSVFSRTAAAHRKKKQQPKADSTTRTGTTDAYHFKFHISPPRKDFSHQPHKQYTYQGDHPEILPRRTMSDTMSQLPEGPSDRSSVGSISSASANSSTFSPIPASAFLPSQTPTTDTTTTATTMNE